jgi:hypothetical protein
MKHIYNQRNVTISFFNEIYKCSFNVQTLVDFKKNNIKKQQQQRNKTTAPSDKNNIKHG